MLASVVEGDVQTGEARERLARLDALFRRRSGEGWRAHLARALGCAPGTLENLRRARLKGVRAALAERLSALLVRELAREIENLEHELAMARAGARRVDADAQRAAVSALAEARRLIGT